MDAASSGGKRDPVRPDLDSLGSELLKQLVLAQQAEIDNLNLLVLKLKRMHFGQRSEKMNADIEQLELGLEDLEANQGRGRPSARANRGQRRQETGAPSASRGTAARSRDDRAQTGSLPGLRRRSCVRSAKMCRRCSNTFRRASR